MIEIDTDINSPYVQRTIINLMRAALPHIQNGGPQGLAGPGLLGLAEEDLRVSPEILREYVNASQAYVTAIVKKVLSELSANEPNGPQPPTSNPCLGLLQALQQEIRALGGVPVKTVPGWREKFASCRSNMPEWEYNEGMSLLEGKNLVESPAR